MSNFKTVEEIYAIVFGSLIRDEGKVISSKFNKIINQFGLDKISAQDLQEIYDEIDSDIHLSDLKDKSIDGEITLDDVEDVKGETPFKDTKVIDTVSNYVTDNKRRLAELREVRKQQEPHAYMNILMEDLREEFSTLNKPILDREPEIMFGGNKKELVVLLSDFHVGQNIA